jgi:2-pyrone-4,6-dicarboxylate lactonase
MNRTPDPAGPDLKTRTPQFTLPTGACDCHVHVIGPAERFPFVPSHAGRADAPKAMLETMHQTIGVDRCVIVHGSTHGVDLSATLDAMETGGGRYRAVVLVKDAITDERLEDLHAAGVRGVRYSTTLGGKGLETGSIERMAQRITAFGWHMVLHMKRDDIVTYADFLKRLPVPLVFDHMAGIDSASGGVDQEAFQLLLSHLKDRNDWAKISGIEKVSNQLYPFEDAATFAKELISAAPDQVIWGTDWPHPNVRPEGRTNDGDLVDLIPSFAPDAETQRKLLVDNPARLYGFESR